MRIESAMERLLFFESEGWNEVILRSCLEQGDIIRAPSIARGEHCWRLTHRSSFSPKRLCEFTTSIRRWGVKEDVRREEWEYYIENYNWLAL